MILSSNKGLKKEIMFSIKMTKNISANYVTKKSQRTKGTDKKK
jgi:hypothetical protein